MLAFSLIIAQSTGKSRGFRKIFANRGALIQRDLQILPALIGAELKFEAGPADKAVAIDGRQNRAITFVRELEDLGSIPKAQARAL